MITAQVLSYTLNVLKLRIFKDGKEIFNELAIPRTAVATKDDVKREIKEAVRYKLKAQAIDKELTKLVGTSIDIDE